MYVDMFWGHIHESVGKFQVQTCVVVMCEAMCQCHMC